jgi:hypothetical protein
LELVGGMQDLRIPPKNRIFAGSVATLTDLLIPEWDGWLVLLKQ